MSRPVSRRALLTMAVAASVVAVDLPSRAAWAAAQPTGTSAPAANDRSGYLLAVAGLGYGLPGQGVVYGYRILAPAGIYRSAAAGSATPADVLDQLQGSRIVLVNGVTVDLERTLTATAGGRWEIVHPTRSSPAARPSAGLEVIAFLPRHSLGESTAITGGSGAVGHVYAVPHRYA